LDLLVGIVACHASGLSAIYTAIATGGLVLFILSAAGLFNFTITGQGGGNSYYQGYQEDVKWPPGGDRIAKWFLQEETKNWTYKVLGPRYDEEVVSGLNINMDNENAPLRYKFDISATAASGIFRTPLKRAGSFY